MNYSFDDFPSIEETRGKLILHRLQHLKKNAGQKFSRTNIYITGKTTVGKTTFENLLIGNKGGFRITGRQDTTDSINLIEFTNGLGFYDLPGIDGRGYYENYNRIVLDLPLRDDYDLPVNPVEKIILNHYKDYQLHTPEEYTPESFHKQIMHKPHLLYYVIAPQKPPSSDEQKYIRALCLKYKVVFIFNIFVDKTTAIHIEDSTKIIYTIYADLQRQHNIILGDPNIVSINCLSGYGLQDLLIVSRQFLDVDQTIVLDDIITYQYVNTPAMYLSTFIDKLKDAGQAVYNMKPDATTELGSVFFSFNKELWRFFNVTKNNLVNSSEKQYPEIYVSKIINQIIEECGEDLFGDVIEKKEKNIGGEIHEDHEKGKEKIGIAYRSYEDNSLALMVVLFIMHHVNDINKITEPEYVDLFNCVKEKFSAASKSKDNAFDALGKLIKKTFLIAYGEDFNYKDNLELNGLKDAVLNLPFIYFFKANQKFLVTSTEVILEWECDSADRVLLNNTIDITSMDSYKTGVLKDTEFSLVAINKFGKMNSAIAVKVFEAPIIKEVALKSVYFITNPFDFNNPTFNFNTTVSLDSPKIPGFAVNYEIPSFYLSGITKTERNTNYTSDNTKNDFRKDVADYSLKEIIFALIIKFRKAIFTK